jgi:hypothetical protein
MMNDPFPMLTTSPKLSPTAPSPDTLARLARGPFDSLVQQPIQGPTRLLASLPPGPAFVQTDLEIDPTKPPADKLDIESFMCCGNVRYIKQAKYTEGAFHLIEHFARRGNWYPADWTWITTGSEEATEQWKMNPGYVGLIDLDHVLPGASSKLPLSSSCSSPALIHVIRLLSKFSSSQKPWPIFHAHSTY